MLQNKFLQTISAILLFAISFTACKKDAFSEQDAITAQTTLLQKKFDNEKSMEQLRQQGVLANTSLTYQLALQNQLAANRNMDSITRAYQRFADSLAIVRNRNADSISARNAGLSDIRIQVVDMTNNSLFVAGATVTLPTTVGTVLQATTDATGIALFPAANNINVPFYVQAIVARTGWVTATTFISRTPASPGSPTVLSAVVPLWNNTNLRNRVQGTITIDNDLTDAATNVVPNQTVTLNTSLNGVNYLFQGTSNATGAYVVNIPDAPNAFTFSNVATRDTAMTLWVNALGGGVDSIPSMQTVTARYTMGATLTNTNTLPTNPFSVAATPNAVNRFHGVVNTADSLGRILYFKGLQLTQVNDNTTQLPNYYFSSGTSGALGQSILTDGSFGNTFQPRFNVPVTTPAITPFGPGSTSTLSVRYVDLLNNSDAAFTAVPNALQLTTQFFNNTGAPQNNGWMVPGTTNVGFPLFNRSVYPTRSTAPGNVNGFDPAAIATGSNANATITQVLTNRTLVNTPFTGTVGVGSFTNVSISGSLTATTVTRNLNFGQAQLRSAVR